MLSTGSSSQTDTSTPRIAVSELRKEYDETVAIQDVSFQAQPGELLTIVGPSGCGKSTLLRVLAGLESEFGGTVQINGTGVREGGSDDVGFVFQEPRLMPWATVRENIRLVMSNPDSNRIDELIAQVGLDGFGDEHPDQLSGGMAQRVSLARGLAYEPEVLLLDEPFSALDAITKYEQQDFLLDVARDIDATVLLVTHDIEEAVYLADRVLVLSGRPGTIKDKLVVDCDRPRKRTGDQMMTLRDQLATVLGV